MTVKLYSFHKFPPVEYDNLMHFQRENWISHTDIGDSFGGVVLTQDEYLRVENAYLSGFDYIMDQCGIVELQALRDSFTIEEAPLLDQATFGLQEEDLVNYEDRSFLDRADIRRFLRQHMRSLSGYAVTNQKDFFIWGWYDLQYIVSFPLAVTIDPREIQKRGMYLDFHSEISPGDPEWEDYRNVLPHYRKSDN